MIKALNLLSFILMVVNLTYIFHVLFIVQNQPASLSQALVSAGRVLFAAMFIGIAIMNLKVLQDEI